MPRDTRSPSAARIAITLGTIVAVVMLGVWGFAALAGALNKGLEPSPVKATTASAVTTAASEPTEAVAATTALPPAKPVAKPLPPAKPVAKPKTAPVPAPTVPAGKYVVVIDAGHQASGDPRTEPIGPGSGTMKARNTSGADGGTTGQHESALNLAVSLKVRDMLQARGVKVVMCRTSQNVVSSNAERAKMANAAKADLFLRVHADGVDDSSQHGFMTMVPAKNQWWSGALLTTSERAGQAVQRASVAATGAKDRGITHRGDMTGFNWAKVPSVLVEMGFLSNPAEDRAMASDAYRTKLATGISNGVMDYLRSSR